MTNRNSNIPEAREPGSVGGQMVKDVCPRTNSPFYPNCPHCGGTFNHGAVHSEADGVVFPQQLPHDSQHEKEMRLV